MRDPARERLLTPALLVFLVAVAASVGLGLATRYPRPDLAASIALLGDGDLDSTERKIVLENMLERADDAGTDRERWAVLLAAVALGRQAAFDDALRRLQPLAEHVVADGARRWLDLGDPVLGNVLGAMEAEARGDGEGAARRWRQVAQQALLTDGAYAFAGSLAR